MQLSFLVLVATAALTQAAAIPPLGTGVTPPGTGITSPETGITLPETGITPPGTSITPPETGITPPETGITPPGTGTFPPVPPPLPRRQIGKPALAAPPISQIDTTVADNEADVAVPVTVPGQVLSGNQ